MTERDSLRKPGEPSKSRFEDRLFACPPPSNPRGEAPGVSALEATRDGWRPTRRTLIGLLAAGAFARFPRLARAQTCSIGVFAHEILVDSLSFFPDGQTIVSAGRDQFVKFWTVPGAALFRVIAADAVPQQVAVSPNGDRIAVAMDLGSLELWSSDGTTRRVLKGHTDTVSGVSFTPDGSQLVSVSKDRTTKVWSVGGATLLSSFNDSEAMTQAAVPSVARRAVAKRGLDQSPGRASSQPLLVTSGSQLYLRLFSTGAVQKTAPGKAFALSPDGATLAAHDGAHLYVYAFPSLNPLVSVAERQNATSLSFSADGKRLAVAYSDAPARLYSAPDLTLVRQMEANDGPCLAAAMDSQNAHLAIASGKSIRLYSLPAGARVPVCFMDLAASSPSSSGIRYVWGGIGYTIGCGGVIPADAICACDCVPGDCPCVNDTGCSCDSDVGCGCDSDSGCSCVSDSSCACVYDAGCSCDSDYGCGCVDDIGCSCDSNSGCGCVGDYGCGCDSDYGCGCDSDSGCGCDGDFGRA